MWIISFLNMLLVIAALAAACWGSLLPSDVIKKGIKVSWSSCAFSIILMNRFRVV